MKLRNIVKKKIHGSGGETLTETLVSVLIISIVSVALASMISTAARVNEIARDYDLKLDGAITSLSTNYLQPVDVTVSVDTAQPVVFTSSVYGDKTIELYSYSYPSIK